MISDPDSSERRWGSRLLYLGVFLFALLVALAALSIRYEWQQRIGQSRSDAIFQLVQGKTPARPTETPGATAWLNLELRRYRERISDPAKARLYGEVAEWQDTRSVPPFFAPLRESPREPAPRHPELPARGSASTHGSWRAGRAAALAARPELSGARSPLVRRHPATSGRQRRVSPIPRIPRTASWPRRRRISSP